MHPPPLKASMELVAALTGQDLAGLNRVQFIEKVEQLQAERQADEVPPSANAKGQVVLSRASIGDSWALATVIKTERALLLN